MDIEVVQPSALSPEDLARWSLLQAADPTLDTPFLSPGWTLAVERAQTGTGELDETRGVRVAVVRKGATAKAFFPARVAGAIAMPVGAAVSDYQGLVADRDVWLDPRDVVAALGVQRLDFTHMICDQPTFGVYPRGTAVSFMIETPQGYAAYAEGRREAGSGVLKDIDKRRRKAEREEGVVSFAARSCSIADFDQLIEWKRAQFRATGQTDIFDTAWTLRLMRDLFEASDADFGGELFTLHIGGRLAAAQFNLRGCSTLHSWIIAHDAAFERYSPGLILFGEILRWMDETPFKTLDLGAGDYRFKHQLANAQCMVGHGFVGGLSPASLLRSAEYGVRAAAEALPLGRVSALPGKAMRRMDLWRGLG